MRLLIVLLTAAAVTSASCSCGPCLPNEVGAPTTPLPRDAGLGEACDDCTDFGDGGCEGRCSAGLSCLFAEKVRTGGQAPLVCSQLCGTTACPSGSVCLAAGADQFSGAGGNLGALKLCLPTCASDDDCRTGQVAGTCLDFADAGERVCHPIGCYEGGCPAGFGCVSMGCPLADSIGPTSRPSIPGWCRRLTGT